MRCVPVAILFLSVAPPMGAAAGDIYGEGPFVANFVGLAETDSEPIQIGPGRTKGLTDSVLTAKNASGAPYLDDQTGRCLGYWIVDETAATFEQKVHCTYIDHDRDMIFEQAEFDPQPLAGAHVGTGRWLGGTGKYQGLSGVFEIRVKPLRSARDGIVQYVGTKEGHSRLPPP